jgi:hypothetical protein
MSNTIQFASVKLKQLCTFHVKYNSICQEFPLLPIVHTDSGATQPPIPWVPEALSPGAKRQGREANHEVKKTWIYTSTPPYVFMA